MPETYRTYDKDFRRGAVDLLLSSGRPLKVVAAELGISANSLRTWRDRALGNGRVAQAEGRSEAPIADAAGQPSSAPGRLPSPPTRNLKKSHEHTLRRPAERYALINSMRNSFSIVELCEALAVSRSGYYASRAPVLSSREDSSLQLFERMRSIHADRHTRSYGSPRMTRQLLDLGLPCSENRVARLMRSDGLRARPRKPFRPKTTDPDHAAHPSPNLLAAEPPALAPGLQLVSDITYIPTREGWLYLAVVMDLFSRSILGWKLSDCLHTNLVTGAIQRALSSRLIPKNAIFHSDRGCQYSASSTRQLLARHALRQSMSAAGYCYDNAFAESFFASLKADLLVDDQPFVSKASAATSLFDYLQSFYNRKRLHSSLGYLSPSAFLHRHLLAIHQPPVLN